MYHIKDDKRCQKSASRIGDAFRELLIVKPLSDITVSDIQRVSGVGRSTFYRLFGNIDDVLVYLVEEELRDTINMYRELSRPDFTMKMLEGIIMEGRELSNVASSGKTHILYDVLRRIITEETEKDDVEFDNTSRYVLAAFAGSCISVVVSWDENGRQESIEELSDILENVLNYEKIEQLINKRQR